MITVVVAFRRSGRPASVDLAVAGLAAAVVALFALGYALGARKAEREFADLRARDYPGFRRVQVLVDPDWARDPALAATAEDSAEGCYRMIFDNADVAYLFRPVRGVSVLDPPVLVLDKGAIATMRLLAETTSCTAQASGLTETEESSSGFPSGTACASLRHAQRDFHFGLGRRSPASGGHRRRPAGRTAPRTGKMREGTKQAQLVAMLRRDEGATIAEVAAVTSWQPHTVCGALAGASTGSRADPAFAPGADRGGRAKARPLRRTLALPAAGISSRGPGFRSARLRTSPRPRGRR